MTRLETIADRQRKSRTRDLAFAAFIALAGIVGLTTIGTAVDTAAAIASR